MANPVLTVKRRGYREVGAIDVVEEYRQPEDQDHALR